MAELLGRKILIVDDDPDNIEFLTILLEDEQCDVVSALSGKEAIGKAKDTFFSVVLLDIRMPGMDGLEVLKKLKVESPQSLVIILTAYGSKENIEKACDADVYDFINKPVDNELLLHLVRKAFDHSDTLLQNKKNKEEILKKYPYESIIGSSSKLDQMTGTIEKIAPTDTCILITGETGTGKELVARSIHYRSGRSGPFIAVNAGSFDDNVLGSELFGHKKGAFTDAYEDRIGYFESCENGTIFLDEIGDISPKMQVSLLRVLQEKTINRLGRTDTIKVNARVIAATNQDIEKMVKGKEFREDLYYRIKSFIIHVPPLRERRGDILPLINHFIKHSNKVVKLSDEALKLLKIYDYPGNIRELEHIIGRAVILCENDVILPKDLPQEVTGRSVVSNVSELYGLPWKKAKRWFEKSYIKNILDKTDGNISEAARITGIDRPEFHKKMNKLGIKANEVEK